MVQGQIFTVHTIPPWTEAFIVSSCGRILLLLQLTEGWIISKKRNDRLYACINTIEAASSDLGKNHTC